MLVIGFQKCNLFISSQRKLGKLYCELKILEFGMGTLRDKENRKGVSERFKEQRSATLYRKIFISWSSGLGILIFFFQIKVN